MAAIVNYGIGNLFSVKKGFERAGFRVVVSNDKEVLKGSDVIVLPGVGSHKAAIANMTSLGIVDVIKEVDNFKFGICLGMQLLYEESEEGGLKGLGILKGKVIRLRGVPKVPHMGWNTVVGESPLLEGLSGEYFYFAHSYYKEYEGRKEEEAVSDYEGVKITALVCSGKVCATQFHPEKSYVNGVRLLKNFYTYARR
ncbi:imidazole glycerol phosphate synthase subunit HisH [Ignicoccus hospitalis]|uniref:imidazole glycerol phosphate synthase subunit HisH n=1 Tax=Ignicoccus hospitalis TaxID=160233 RepID=UPI000A013C97|nr:imidazole glycerol phosphate synthase subunit HisH [Desulfurococcaceae archaeon]